MVYRESSLSNNEHFNLENLLDNLLSRVSTSTEQINSYALLFITNILLYIVYTYIYSYRFSSATICIASKLSGLLPLIIRERFHEIKLTIQRIGIKTGRIPM